MIPSVNNAQKSTYTLAAPVGQPRYLLCEGTAQRLNTGFFCYLVKGHYDTNQKGIVMTDNLMKNRCLASWKVKISKV